MPYQEHFQSRHEATRLAALYLDRFGAYLTPEHTWVFIGPGKTGNEVVGVHTAVSISQELAWNDPTKSYVPKIVFVELPEKRHFVPHGYVHLLADYCADTDEVVEFIGRANASVIILRNPPYPVNRAKYGRAIVKMFRWAKESGRKMLVTLRSDDIDDDIVSQISQIGENIPDPFNRDYHIQDDVMFVV